MSPEYATAAIVGAGLLLALAFALGFVTGFRAANSEHEFALAKDATERLAGRSKCGIGGCIGSAIPLCAARSCAHHCQLHCSHAGCKARPA